MKWFFSETPASWNELKWPQVDSSEVSLDVFDVDFTFPFDSIHFQKLILILQSGIYTSVSVQT